MDSNRLFQFLVISLFSAAIALIGLNELSNRFVKSGVKENLEAKAPDLVRQLRGETNPMKPLENRPTPAGGSEPEEPGAAKGPSTVGVVSSGLKRVTEKMLPR